MADGLVADDIDHRRLTRLERALERRNDLVGFCNVLAVTSHLVEDFVVTDVLEHVEWVGAILEQRHRFEARSPRAVVPEDADERQLVARRRLHVPSADTESAVAHHQHDLLAGTRELRAYAHAESVADGGERSRVDDLPGKTADEILAHPSG